jgi:hypothetical protein
MTCKLVLKKSKHNKVKAINNNLGCHIKRGGIFYNHPHNILLVVTKYNSLFVLQSFLQNEYFINKSAKVNKYVCMNFKKKCKKKGIAINIF